jgi:ABC-2 type transport system ATP-binding protein
LEQIADYIIFIYNGEIIFSDKKDTINDRYHIVKGAKELLDADIRNMLNYVRETSVGFEALTDEPEKVRRIMGSHVTLESATLEEIMVDTIRSKKHV